jgi:hypothetical protein
VLAALAAVGIMLSAIILRWHLGAGRAITMFALYLTIVVLEFGGGIIQEFVNGSSAEFDIKINALVLRLASLVPFSCGYLAVALFLRWPSGPSAARKISCVLECSVGPRERLRLWSTFAALAAITLYPLFVKVQVAEGLSSFLASSYQMRFGTYGETTLGNTAVVIAGILAAPLVAIVALLAMDAATGITKHRSALWLLGAAMAFNILAAVAHGRRMGIAVAIAVPLVAWHFQRPFRRVVIFQLCTLLIAAAVVVNWMHYYLYTTTADWDEKSVGETTFALLAPHEHLKTLSTIIAATERHEVLGPQQLLLSSASLFPRMIWPDKPSSELLGSLAIQDWAGLPYHYQMAITDVGEAIACLGLPGLAALALGGIVYSLLDYLLFTSMLGRSVVIGFCLSRVLADQGMGVAALAQTLLTTILTLSMLRAIVPRQCFRSTAHLTNQLRKPAHD